MSKNTYKELAEPGCAIQFSASTTNGWPNSVIIRCRVSINLTPNIGAAENNNYC